MRPKESPRIVLSVKGIGPEEGIGTTHFLLGCFGLAPLLKKQRLAHNHFASQSFRKKEENSPGY